MRNIILCGFMGCGKTTVGKQLAMLTKRNFIDMDEYIEQQSSMTITEIFHCLGEKSFRQLERDACKDLAKQEGLIIATGGGALTFPENANILATTGDIVLLNVPIDIILMRIKNDTVRPLLSCRDREAVAKKLYNSRLSLYHEAANIVINATASPNLVALAICNELNIDISE